MNGNMNHKYKIKRARNKVESKLLLFGPNNITSILDKETYATKLQDIANFMQIASSSHANLIQISCIFHANFMQVLCKYFSNFTKIFGKFMVNLKQISYISHEILM